MIVSLNNAKGMLTFFMQAKTDFLCLCFRFTRDWIHEWLLRCLKPVDNILQRRLSEKCPSVISHQLSVMPCLKIQKKVFYCHYLIRQNLHFTFSCFKLVPNLWFHTQVVLLQESSIHFKASEIIYYVNYSYLKNLWQFQQIQPHAQTSSPHIKSSMDLNVNFPKKVFW